MTLHLPAPLERKIWQRLKMLSANANEALSYLSSHGEPADMPGVIKELERAATQIAELKKLAGTATVPGNYKLMPPPPHADSLDTPYTIEEWENGDEIAEITDPKTAEFMAKGGTVQPLDVQQVHSILCGQMGWENIDVGAFFEAARRLGLTVVEG